MLLYGQQWALDPEAHSIYTKVTIQNEVILELRKIRDFLQKLTGCEN